MRVYLNCSAGDGKPAARIGDSVSCPIHGTSSITTGSANTFFDRQPAARVTDRTSCGDTIVEGSTSVTVNGKPAAFIGCSTAHGGKIISGSPNAFIGTTAVQPAAESSTDGQESGLNHSLLLDFSELVNAGNHNGIQYAGAAIEITDPYGSYMTTITTDESGLSGRFFTQEQEEVTAWVLAQKDWTVSEEYEDLENWALEEIGE